MFHFKLYAFWWFQWLYAKISIKRDRNPNLIWFDYKSINSELYKKKWYLFGIHDVLKHYARSSVAVFWLTLSISIQRTRQPISLHARNVKQLQYSTEYFDSNYIPFHKPLVNLFSLLQEVSISSEIIPQKEY